MTGDLPPAGGSADGLLQHADRMLQQVAEEIGEAVERLKAGGTGDAKAVAQAVRELRDAFRVLMDERTRVDRLRKQVAGVVGASELDFDAARDEICRRLARLRDAGEG